MRTGNQRPVASRSPEKQHCLEPENYCAYNRTREYLLCSDVDVADFCVASFNDRIPTLATDWGVGLWMVPFRGISLIGEHALLDLIYLDANAVVIDVVESFPTFRISNASPPAASVLALPMRTISSTQTQRGDQLLICAAAELRRRLLLLPGSTGDVETAHGTDSGKVQPIYSGSGNRLQLDESSGEQRLNRDAYPLDRSPSRQSHGDAWDDRKVRGIKPKKNWLQRWWSLDLPEPRKAPRESFPGLSAYFWTGGSPVEHGVRDISLTGLYVVTDERWFLGTQVRMTLTDSGESIVTNSITANASVVRWGNDGVGLKFVIEDEKGVRGAQAPLVTGIDKKELNRFLELVKSGKRDSETRDAASRSNIVRDDATQNTDAQSFPSSARLLSIGDERGGNSSLMGASSDTASVNSSWEGIEGVEALRHSNDPSLPSRIPAHVMVSPIKREEAISGHADPDFHDLFIGPINSSLLIDSLKDLPRPVSVAGTSYLSNPSPLPLPVVVSSTPSTRRPCILLIDDEYLDITFLAGTLEEDYEIIFAMDGVTALESAGRNMPDLILLDVMMPGIDGFEVCRRLKADIRTKEIPVIFITGLSEVAAETKGLRLGAVDYISKPFNAAPLRARVNMHVKFRMEQEC